MLCTEEVIQQVWEKGTVMSNNDPKYWRQDQCGAWISRSNYGCQQSPFGWEINYILPQTVRGGQDLPNLRPVQWKNNIYQKDGNTVCVLKAVKTKNQDIPSVVINRNPVGNPLVIVGGETTIKTELTLDQQLKNFKRNLMK